MDIKKTHPWLTFEINLQRVNHDLWMLLGEAQSKCEHIAGTPLQPKLADQLHRIYLAKGVNATTAIEGNTLTEEDVLKQLEGKLDVPPSKAYMKQEVQNIVDACNWILRETLSDRPLDITPERLCQFNGMVLKDLELDEDIKPGGFRQMRVGVNLVRYLAPDPRDCPRLVQRLCEWLKAMKGDLVSFGPIVQGLFRAIVAHLYIAWIHPFGDGNGRTARLVEFQILLNAGVPTPAAHLLSNHYNQTRTQYYRQLDLASKTGGDSLPFIKYAAQGFVDGLKENLTWIRKQQYEICWRDYVHDRFREMDKSAVHRRLRHLILDLSQKTEPVPLGKLMEVSQRTMLEYRGKTLRTLLRDARKLIDMKLIRLERSGCVANREVILAFLPARRADADRPRQGG
ncbi:MAG: Fic family protein [bacterium]|nr:Fic family protein [bacterium]